MQLLFVNPCLRYNAPHRYLPVGLGYVMTSVKEAGFSFDLLDIDLHQYDDDTVVHRPLAARKRPPAGEVFTVEERRPLVAAEVADARAPELVGLALLAVVLDRDVTGEVHRVAQVRRLDAVHPDL